MIINENDKNERVAARFDPVMFLASRCRQIYLKHDCIKNIIRHNYFTVVEIYFLTPTIFKKFNASKIYSFLYNRFQNEAIKQLLGT